MAVPAECECPADIHHEPDCKHKVALATIGGPTVLNAAVNVETSSATSSDSSPETDETPPTPDGGTSTATSEPDSGNCPNGDPTCPGPDADTDRLSCFACYGATESV